MSDAPAVTVLYAFKDLSEQTLGILLIQSSVHLGLQVPMQTASSHVLHHQNHIFGGVNDFVESDDALVFHLLHQLDFPLHTLSPVGIQQLVLLVYLHCHLLVRWLVQPQPHHCICSLANLLSYYVLIK